MKRKVIQQSKQAYTVTLPIKWVRDRNIVAGDELEIAVLDDQLLIGADKKKGEKKTIILQVEGEQETQVRTAVVNAYRSGFDIITLEFSGSKQWLNDIVDKFMIGFELFEQGQGKYIIESISEPSFENFDDMIGRSFFMLKEVLKQLPEHQIEDLVHRIQKYDNFLKRSISKELFTVKGSMFLWQFLSQLTQIARACLLFKQFLEKNTLYIEGGDLRAYDGIMEMVEILHKSFLKKDHKLLQELHTKKNLMIEHVENSKKMNQVYAYHMINMSRMIFIANSPLHGYLYEQK